MIIRRLIARTIAHLFAILQFVNGALIFCNAAHQLAVVVVTAINTLHYRVLCLLVLTTRARMVAYPLVLIVCVHDLAILASGRFADLLVGCDVVILALACARVAFSIPYCTVLALIRRFLVVLALCTLWFALPGFVIKRIPVGTRFNAHTRLAVGPGYGAISRAVTVVCIRSGGAACAYTHVILLFAGRALRNAVGVL